MGYAAHRYVDRLFGGLPRTFWWLWLSTLINWIGRFVVPFMAIYLTDELRLSSITTGVVLSLFGGGGLISVLVGGAISDRVGRRLTIVCSHSLSAATMAVLSLTKDPVAIGILMFVLGMVGNAAEPATKALIADILPIQDRQRGYAANMWALNLGYAIGPIIGAGLVQFSFALIFICNALATVCTAILVFIKVPNDRHAATERHASSGIEVGFREIFEDKTFMWFIVFSFVFSLIYIQSTISLPIALTKEGYSPSDYSILLFMNGFLLIIIQMPASDLISKFSRSMALAVSGLLVGLGFGSHMLADSLGAYIVGVIIWTVAEVINMPLAASVTSDLAPSSARGRYMGIFMGTWSASSLIGPILAGPIIEFFGPDGIWFTCALLGAVCCIGRCLISKSQDRRLYQAGARH